PARRASDLSRKKPFGMTTRARSSVSSAGLYVRLLAAYLERHSGRSPLSLLGSEPDYVRGPEFLTHQGLRDALIRRVHQPGGPLSLRTLSNPGRCPGHRGWPSL